MVTIMANVEFNVPNYAHIALKTNKEIEVEALTKIEEVAKENSPVDTAFYRNNIQAELSNNQVVANAEYSAPIEYGVGGTARKPNPVMRNAGIEVQKVIADQYGKRFEENASV